MKKPKIAFFDIYNPIPINSGGDWYRYQILSGLTDNYDVCFFYTIKNKDQNGYTPENIKFKIKYLDSTINWGRKHIKMQAIRPEFLINDPFCDGFVPDVVFSSVYTYHIAKKISEKYRTKMILVMHNIEKEYLKNLGSLIYLPVGYYERYIIKNAWSILTISEHDGDYARKYTNNDQIFVVPPKINLDIFRPNGVEHIYEKKFCNVLFYGSLDREQNIGALRFIKFELMPLLKKRDNNNRIKINIFGSGTPPKILNLENDSEINFFGSVQDAGRYIRGSDIVIVPVKNSGGMKIRILESLLCGKPTIASKEAVLGVPDEIKKYVMIADSSEDFLRCIYQIIDNPELFSPNVDAIRKDMDDKSFNKFLNHLSDSLKKD